MQNSPQDSFLSSVTNGQRADLANSSDDILRGMDLRDSVRLLNRRWRLVASIIIACGALALLASLLLTPQYRASTRIMLDTRRTNSVDLGSMFAAVPVDNAAVRSEMDIISSRAVVDRVITKLSLLDDPEFSSQGMVSNLGMLLFGSTDKKKVESEAKSATDRAREEDDLSYRRTLVADNLSKRLEMLNDGRSLSIGINFSSSDPKKAAAIANAFASEYLVDQLEARYDVTARANKWIEERLVDLKAKVETSEGAVEDFRRNSGLIQIDGSTVAARQMEDINKQLSVARGETSQAEAKLRGVQSMLKSANGVGGAADVLASPLIQRLREQEAEVRRREAEMASRYGDLHPKIINIRAEYRDLQNKIAEEVARIVQGLENEVDVARAKERRMASDLKTLETRAGKEMKESVTLRQLEREAESNRTLYENFLTRFKETGEQQQMELSDSRIIAPAEPPIKPTFPNRLLFLLLGMAMGSIIGIMAAWLVEYFDRGFRRSDQVESETGHQVIGLVPELTSKIKIKPEAYAVEKPLSAYGEAMRTIRTAIHFSNVDSPPRTVIVTSAGPEEGKTTFCMSLGRTIARAGNRVLLIDADMRKPRIALALGLGTIEGGLAAALTGEKTLAEVTYSDPAGTGLDIIPTAAHAPNAQDMLGSQQMRKLLEEAKQKYDLVIIDTPPILAVADAAVIATAADTTLFLVRWAVTPRDSVIRALRQLRNLGGKVAGIILSQVNTEEHIKYGDGYYHKNYQTYYHD